MAHVFPLWTPPALPISGRGHALPPPPLLLRRRAGPAAARPIPVGGVPFPVGRIFCVGRNYAEHQKEMGGDGRETPFFFLKSEFALIPRGGTVHYPAKTSNYHYETELVVALGKGGRRVDAKRANDHIFGYAVGLD